MSWDTLLFFPSPPPKFQIQDCKRLLYTGGSRDSSHKLLPCYSRPNHRASLPSVFETFLSSPASFAVSPPWLSQAALTSHPHQQLTNFHPDFINFLWDCLVLQWYPAPARACKWASSYKQSTWPRALLRLVLTVFPSLWHPCLFLSDSDMFMRGINAKGSIDWGSKSHFFSHQSHIWKSLKRHMKRLADNRQHKNVILKYSICGMSLVISFKYLITI